METKITYYKQTERPAERIVQSERILERQQDADRRLDARFDQRGRNERLHVVNRVTT